jgi:CRISPR-associated protein Cas1
MKAEMSEKEDSEQEEKKVKASEGLMDQSVIYVKKQGTQIGLEEGRIEVREKGEVLQSFPDEQVDTINVFGGVNLTTPFFKECNKKEITVNYFTIHGNYEGSFLPEKNTIARVRRKQYGLSEEKERDIVHEMTRSKARNMKTILMRKGVKETEKIGKVLDTLKNEEPDKDTLRAREGEASDYYFQKIDETLRKGWTFEKRTRRPPEDHINSLLSLTYTFLKNEVLSGLRQYNLDPFLGVMHVDRHGRPSLALDLMEEFRPLFADTFTMRLINRQTLLHDDFRKDNRLKDEKFSTFMEKWEDYMNEQFLHPKFEYQVTRRKAIRLQAILLRKVITGENQEYHPLVFKR